MTLDLPTRHPEMRFPHAVLALPDGGALVAAHIATSGSILRLDQYGAVSYIFKYKPYGLVTGFIMTLDEVFVLLLNGVITRVKLNDGTEVKSYEVDVDVLWDGVSVDGDNLLMIDSHRGEVFRYRLSDQNKEVKVRNLHPTCINIIPGNEKRYVVCASRALLVYDSTWKLQRSIQDWFVQAPASVVVLPNNNFLMADMDYQRASVLSADWTLICHVIQEKDRIDRIMKVSFRQPDLWIVYARRIKGQLSWNSVKRIKIFKT